MAGKCLWLPVGGRIELSAHFVERNPVEVVEDTIRHEIAHALAGPDANHGPDWQKMAVLVGAKPERCYTQGDIQMPMGRWRATCPGCGTTHHRFRKPIARPYHCIACGPCKGRLNWSLVG